MLPLCSHCIGVLFFLFNLYFSLVCCWWWRICQAQVAKVSTGRQHPWTVPAVAPSSSSNSSSANSWGQAQTPRGGSGCEQRGVAAGGDFHGGGEQERAEAGGGRGFSIGGDEVSESPDGLCD